MWLVYRQVMRRPRRGAFALRESELSVFPEILLLYCLSKAQGVLRKVKKDKSCEKWNMCGELKEMALRCECVDYTDLSDIQRKVVRLSS